MNIPAEVANNPTINVYTVLSENGGLLFQAKRKAHPDDKPQVMDGEVIRCNGYFFGEWYDNTTAAKAELGAKKKVSAFHKPSEVVATAQQKRDEELAQAEALLAAFGKKEN